MIEIGYTLPMMIALVTSIILLIYGFEEKNKKATYIYFGFFIITSILFTLHVMAHWFNLPEKLLLIMRLEYVLYIFLPPFMAYAVSEMFSYFSYFNKRKIIIFTLASAIISLIILFTDNFFIKYNQYLLKLVFPYNYFFFAYYLGFLAIASIKLFKRTDDVTKNKEVVLPFTLINSGTILVFTLVMLSELFHQINGTAEIAHYSHEIGILASILFIFYVSFKYKLIEIEKSLYIFGIVIISLIIIATLLSISKDSSDELKDNLIQSTSVREKEMISYVEERIDDFFFDANITLNSFQESMSLDAYIKNGSIENQKYALMRLNAFEKRIEYPVCFIEINSKNMLCSDNFKKNEVNYDDFKKYLSLVQNKKDYAIIYPKKEHDISFYFLKAAIRDGRIIGLFISEMNMNEFKKEFEEREVSEQSENWIIDESGLILEHCDSRLENKTLNDINNGYRWINESLNVLNNEDGTALLVKRSKINVGGKTWYLGLGTPINDITSESENVLVKIRNSSFISILLIFIASTGLIVVYIRYNKNLNILVEKKTAEIGESKAEVEMINASLKKANNELNSKLRELEETKKAMMNLLEDFSESNEKLKSLDLLKTDFMNISSHELKTPLISIMGYTELLMDSKNLNAEEKNNLSIIHRNSERLKALVGDILMISKLESGSIPYHETELDMKSLVDDAIIQIASVAKQKNIEITVDAKSAKIKGDKDLLSYIFPNLLSNAVKFTPENGKILVELHETQDKITGFVKDTGIGIPNKLINNLFQKFYQIDSSRDRKFGGTGLGLSICKEIIELHAGKIWVESVEGKGSTFKFEISKKGKTKKE